MIKASHRVGAGEILQTVVSTELGSLDKPLGRTTSFRSSPSGTTPQSPFQVGFGKFKTRASDFVITSTLCSEFCFSGQSQVLRIEIYICGF